MVQVQSGGSSPPTEHRLTKLSIKEQFARLESKSKCLLQATMEKMAILKQCSDKPSSDATTANYGLSRHAHNFNGRPQPQVNIDEEEGSIRELFGQLRDNLGQMKSLSGDMNTVQVNKSLSPRIVDQIKSWELTVDGLHSSLRKLQLDFQQIMNVKRREDLLSLSKSPFDEIQPLNSSVRNRATGPGSISSSTTDTLLKTRQTLLETVQRSTGTLEQLAQSSLTIVTSQEDLKEQNTVVSSSRKLLSKYGRREWTDRVLICLGLVFFFAVVGYIAQKRMF